MADLGELELRLVPFFHPPLVKTSFAPAPKNGLGWIDEIASEQYVSEQAV